MSSNRHRIVELGKLIAHRAGGQVLLFLSTLFAAKYTTPTAFGEVGLFTSICSFAAMAAALRFEVKGMVCRRTLTKQKFIGLAYVSNSAVFVGSTFVISVMWTTGDLQPWIWLLPPGVLLSSLVQFVFPAQNSEIKTLRKLGWMTQIATAAAAVFQIVSALLSPTSIALIASRVCAWLIAAIYMAKSLSEGVRGASLLEKKDLRRLFSVSKREIGYGIPAAIISGLAFQIPTYIFSLHSMKPEVGIYWFSFNLLFVPYLVAASSARPIFLRHISSNKASPEIYNIIRKYVFWGLSAGAVYSALACGGCWIIVKYLLDDKWQDASAYSASLAILSTVLVAQTPISFSVSALGLQRLDLTCGISQVIARATVVYLALESGCSAQASLVALSFVSAIIYFCYIFIGLSTIKLRADSSITRNALS